MKYQLVLQWTTGLEDDHAALIAMEEALERSMPAGAGDVDGHDLGSGEMNLFVHTDDPARTFAAASRALGDDPRWVVVRAGYRLVDGDDHVVLWPPTLDRFSVV